MADDDDDLYDSVSGLADRLKLKGRDREKFVHEAMTRGGYDAIPQYVRRQEDDDDDDRGSGFFSRGSRSSSRERRGGSDRDDWYGS